MGRNKYPEQTLERILDVSSKLFIEKGYEQTSIQDILDALNLSKGGLYHHFKSKEEILEVVMQKRAQYVSDMLHDAIQSTNADNAREKLKKILYHLLNDTETRSFDTVLTSQRNNPRFVAGGLQECMKKDAPVISGLIQEGIEDGSLQVTQPDFCAEIFLLLLNYWANPVLFRRSYSETKERLNYLQSVMCLLGLDIVDERFMDAFLDAYKKMGAY